MAAHGFQQRWLAKVLAKQFWLAGTKFSGTGADYNLNAGWNTLSTGSTAMPNTGLTEINSTAGPDVYVLNDPTLVGQEKSFSLLTVATGVFIKTVAATINGASNLVMHSTVLGSINLRAASTARWDIVGTYQPVFSTGVFPTLSTTT